MNKYLWLLALMCLVSSACANDRAPDMVLVEGGVFDMGEPNGRDNPIHRVQVDGFYISIYEVTVKEWKAFTVSEKIDWPWHSDSFTGFVYRKRTVDLPDDWPIYYLTWYHAIWYCNWLSRQQGLKPAYEFNVQAVRSFLDARIMDSPSVRLVVGASGYRLPTEAEWEYAAIEGNTGSSKMDEAWYKGNSDGEPHPVGSKRANSLGVFDMLGNVAEWCWDYYDADYYRRSPSKNPLGPDHGNDPDNYAANETNIRTARGGGWMTSEKLLDPHFRNDPLDILRGPIGVRLVRSAKAD